MKDSVSTVTIEKSAAGRSTTAVVAVTGFYVALRIGAGLLFMQHGAQKLFGWLGGFGGIPGATADVFSLMGLAGVLEFFGGAMIVVGLFTTPVAAVLALQMVVAYFMAHLPQGPIPVLNGGEPAFLFALIFAFVAARGSGPASLDHLRSRPVNDDVNNDERFRGRA